MKKLFICIFVFFNYCFSNSFENNYSIKNNIGFYLNANNGNNLLFSTDKNFLICDNGPKLINCDIRQFIPEIGAFQNDIRFYLKTNHKDNLLFSTDKNFLITDNEPKLIDCDIRQFIPEIDPFKYEKQTLLHQQTPSSLFLIGGSTVQKLSGWDKVDKVKFSIVTISLVGLGIYAHGVQMRSWWSHDRGPFNIREDWDYACQLDKIGHGFAAMAIARIIADLYTYTGVGRGTSLLIGTLGALSWQSYLEIMDGFGTTWGFSPSDFISDVLGSLYPIAQEYYKPLRNFNFKFSYYPSPFLTTGVYEKDPFGNEYFVKKGNITEDYAGQVYWFSVNIHEYLPKKLKQYWPQWLSIAVGYSLYNWNGSMEQWGYRVTDRELWLSLDYNLEKLPGDTEFLKLLKKIFNQFHLPAPAVRLTPSVVWYGLFYAHIIK